MGIVLIGVFCIGFASCQSPHEPCCRTEAKIDNGWPKADRPFVQVSYCEVRQVLPVVAGAEFVNDDEICMTCHEAYVKSFANNVHRQGKCESCHGPASKHVEGRGKEPGLIFSFKQGNPAVRAEACLKCHEENQCAVGCRWRTSKHANCGVTCVDCHRGHYNVPPGTPATTAPSDAALLDGSTVKLTSFHMTANAPAADPAAAQLPSLRGTSRNLAAIAPNICYRCHCDKTDLQRIAGPHQICGPNGFNCTTCHDPHGQIKESSRRDLCLSCHAGCADDGLALVDPRAQRRRLHGLPQSAPE